MSTIERLNSSRLRLIKSEFLDALSNADSLAGFLSFTSSSLYFLGSPLEIKANLNPSLNIIKKNKAFNLLAFISLIKSKEFWPASFCFGSIANLTWLF